MRALLVFSLVMFSFGCSIVSTDHGRVNLGNAVNSKSTTTKTVYGGDIEVYNAVNAESDYIVGYYYSYGSKESPLYSEYVEKTIKVPANGKNSFQVYGVAILEIYVIKLLQATTFYYGL